MRTPSPAEPRAADLAACRAVIRACSRSFYAASCLLPRDVRDAAIATYAFCRAADDDVDEAGSLADAAARHRLRRERLARIYAGRPDDAPADRAFAWVVRHAGIPRSEPEALLDGMADDLGPRRVADLDELLCYAWRAAGVVGAMMSRIMGRPDDLALRRAVDLGIAMQLTNIARGSAAAPSSRWSGSRSGAVSSIRGCAATAGATTSATPPRCTRPSPRPASRTRGSTPTSYTRQR